MEKINTPMAVIIAGIIIALALVVTGGIGGDDKKKQVNTDVQNGTTDPMEVFDPISSDDYIRGSRDAQVIIVEYSDLECPFCQRFHMVLNQIVNEYDESEVAWVYRHAPIVQLHPKAPREALAAECAGALGGNNTFWNYIDKVFEVSPGNNGLDLALLPQIAEGVGLSQEAFLSCLEEGKEYQDKISSQFQNAVDTAAALGVSRFGTPFSVIITQDGTITPLQGAQPIEAMRTRIDELLR